MSWFSKKQRHGSVGESTKLDSSISSNETSQRQIFIQSYTEGACNPLDWEAMPLTLQMKFPHWKDQNFPSPTTRRKDAEERNLPSPPVKKGTHVPPINSIPYIVMQCDTLASIALKFDISQGEIARNNNIVLGGSCPIYPGELLYIPDSSVVIEKTNSTENNNGKVATNNEGVDFKTESSSSLQEEQSLEEEVTTTHIQIISKFMSDQLCVLGTLMINKQSLMFRPSLNDPLVEEQGVAAYEVLIPLSEIVYAYITLNYTPPENSMFASPSPINEESPLHSHSPQLKPDLNPSPSNENTKDVANNETHSELDPINLDLVNEETNEEKNQKLEDSGEKEKKLESSDEGEYGDDPRSLAGPWRFLYVRVSQSSQQNSSAPVIGIEIPNSNARETAVQSVRTWFIFAVPTVRLKDIHSFLCTHHPMSQSADNIASDIESSLTSNNKLEIINLRGQYSDDSLPVFERHYSSSWEIFSVRDVQPIRIECMEVESTLPLPSLLESSDLITTEHLRKLALNLVSSAIGHDWFLVYSTFKHGISLHTLYRNMAKFGDTPTVLLVQDTYGKLFGAMLSCSMRISERFYGTGESLLFSFDESGQINIYSWTGINDYIVKGSTDSVAIGSGDGHFGLWMDESLNQGASLRCSTFNNEPLATKEHFMINGVEVWGFV